MNLSLTPALAVVFYLCKTLAKEAIEGRKLAITI